MRVAVKNGQESAMKNPMDRQLEKRLSERAVTIGREGDTAAFAELLELLASSSANVRRLSASALGKLAWLGVDQAAAVVALMPVVRQDPHPQTRQYAIRSNRGGRRQAPLPAVPHAGHRRRICALEPKLSARLLRPLL